MHPSVGIVIPSFQAIDRLPFCLPPLLQSSLKPRILVIDSSSTDGTAALAEKMGAEVLVIPKREFNHGTTREIGRKYLGTAIVIMMTQDAYAVSSEMPERLIAPLVNGQAAVAYARQLPHQNAGFFGAFSRKYNYPASGHIRSIRDVNKYGSYTFFCSNSCAAYLNEALDEIGGFPRTLFGEDTACVAKLLHRNRRIAYVAEAEVFHSHDYSLREEFTRHFDMGLARRSFEELLAIAGKDTKRGKEYTRMLFQELRKTNPGQIPYAFLHTGAKFIGYSIGKRAEHAPLWLKKILSGQKYYWNTP